METDRNSPPRMLIKNDIEKAYNALNWSAIIATLTRMKFLNVWISWIKACLTSSSFSLLINGSPTPWFTSPVAFARVIPFFLTFSS